MDRRTFLRVSALAALGYTLLPGCDSGAPALAAQDTRTPALGETGSLDGLLAFRPGDVDYATHCVRFNKRVQKRPAVIVLARTTAEISRAVRYASRHHLPVAIKSGGHSFEGFSSNDGGLVVDVSLMNSLEWGTDNDGRRMIRVGPGLTLGGLYDHVLPKGYLLPAGSCGTVGIGGLTLGGGYGLFSRRWGLTCDHLVDLTLVDGEGRVRHGRQDAELLWACRGGGNGNFGVVSSMTFYVQPASAGLFSHRFKAYDLDPTRADQLLRAWSELAIGLPPTSFSAFVLNRRTLTILVTDTDNTDPALHRVLDSLETKTDKATRGTRQDLPAALRRYYGIDHPLYFKNASAGFYRSYDDVAACFPAVAETVGRSRGLIFQVNTLGGAINDPQRAAASAFAHRDCPFLGELQAYYDRPEQEPAILDSFRAVQGLLAGVGVSRHYRNYPDLDFGDDPARAYYGDHVERLRNVKRRYDPTGVFDYPHAIRP